MSTPERNIFCGGRAQQRREPESARVAFVLGAQSGYSSSEKMGMPTVADQPMVANIVISVIPGHNRNSKIIETTHNYKNSFKQK